MFIIGNGGKLHEGILAFLRRAGQAFWAKKSRLSAGFKLQKGDFTQLIETRNTVLHKRIEKQPLDFPSAGSVFKRPANDYASRLIDDTGLRGLSVGGAKVSEKHAGFIVNFNHATPQDIKSLMEQVREKVKEKHGVELELEQILWGKFD